MSSPTVRRWCLLPADSSASLLTGRELELVNRGCDGVGSLEAMVAERTGWEERSDETTIMVRLLEGGGFPCHTLL